MSTIELLTLAHDQFGDLLATVGPEDWTSSTPCEDWAVSDLVGHAVCGEMMTRLLLEGATADEAIAALPVLDLEDAQGQYESVFKAAQAAFSSSFGSLDGIVHHPVGDIPAGRMLGFRVGDMTVHHWDLARSIGADEQLDPRLVESVWSQLEPMAPMIGTLGAFGDGPSGNVPDDAPLQTRLLDLTGRRP